MLATWLILLASLVIVWVIASFPVYVAGKLVTAGRATFLEAMLATVVGPVVFGIVFAGATLFLLPLFGGSAAVWATFLAFLAWLAVYRSLFKTGWLGALGIAVLAVVVSLILYAILGFTFGTGFLQPVQGKLI
jgi:hypothetical protein